MRYSNLNGNDDRTRHITYAGWNSQNHIYGLVCRSELKATASPFDLFSGTEYRYDSGGVCAQPSNGNMTAEEVLTSATAGGERLITTYTHDRGRVKTATNDEGTVTQTNYGAHGQVVKTIQDVGPANTSFNWESETLYDDYARPTTVKDINNRETNLNYDQWNRLINVTLPGNTTTNANFTFEYQPQRRPAWVRTRQLQDGSNYIESVDYQNGFGEVVQTQTKSPNIDKRWVAPTETDHLGRTRYQAAQYEKSDEMDPWASDGGYVLPDWTSVQNYQKFTYEKAGADVRAFQMKYSASLWDTRTQQLAWVTRHFDAKGRADEETVDAFGNLKLVQEKQGAGGTAVYAETDYFYDKADRLIKVIAPGNAQTEITYDRAGRKKTLDNPDSGTWTYTYDGNSNVTTMVNEGLNATNNTRNTTTTAYDALDRPIEVKVNGKKAQTYTYDPSGNRGAVSYARQFRDSGHLMAWQRNISFDGRGRPTVTQELVRDNSLVWSKLRFVHGYNEANQPTSTRYPSNDNNGLGETVTYGYDTRTGLPTSLQGDHPYVTSQTYSQTGQPLVRTGGSGSNLVKRTLDYENSTARLKRLWFGTGNQANNVQRLDNIVYDKNGNIEELRDWRNSNQWQCFEYDQYDRLTSAFTSNSCPNPSTVGVGSYNESGYTYDAKGNITYAPGKGTYTYGAGIAGLHAVTKIQDGNTVNATFDYDEYGNMTARTVPGTTQTMTYDGQNRLVTSSDGAEYTYYADGMRGTLRKANGDSSRYSATGLVDVTRKANETVLTKHYYFAGERVAQNAVGGDAFFIVNDHLGSPMGTVKIGDVGQQEKQLYKAYGEQRYSDGLPSDLDFTNQRLDDNTGLHYYKARYYDSYAGRFTMPDSIVDGATRAIGYNRYAYVSGNPVNFVDPTGHEECLADYSYCWDDPSGAPGGKNYSGPELGPGNVPTPPTVEVVVSPNGKVVQTTGNLVFPQTGDEYQVEVYYAESDCRRLFKTTDSPEPFLSVNCGSTRGGSGDSPMELSQACRTNNHRVLNCVAQPVNSSPNPFPRVGSGYIDVLDAGSELVVDVAKASAVPILGCVSGGVQVVGYVAPAAIYIETATPLPGDGATIVAGAAVVGCVIGAVTPPGSTG